MNTFFTILDVSNQVVQAMTPFVISIVLLIGVPLAIVWIILKITNVSTHIVGKILVWLALIFVLIIVLWSFLAILSSAVGIA